MAEDSPNEEEFRFHTVGEQLKAERERQKLTLADLAAQTRVPMRHLEAIEASDFNALPGSTYTLGFVRSYARMLGMDAAKISSEMREEMAQGGHASYQAPAQNYEPADPSRVPSRTLAWTAAAIGVLLVVAYLVWRSMTLGDGPAVATGTEDKAAAVASRTSAPAKTAQTPPADGEVVLTATDQVWVKIYDADNNRIFEKEMAAGETFTVPKDANNPMIVTGRPNVINVTVGGQPVPPLGPPERTVADVGVSAAALLARAPAASNGGEAAAKQGGTATQ